LTTDIYSTPIVDNVIVPYFFLHQEIKFPPRK